MNNVEHTPARRTEDKDRLSAYNALWDRWSKLLMPFLLGLAGWFIADVWAPLREVPAMQIRQAMLVRSDSLGRIERAETKAILTILVRMRCLDLTPRDREVIGLDCGAIPSPDPEVVRRALEGQPTLFPERK